MPVFQFSTFNHCEMGQRGLEDLIAIMTHQLRALGHDARSGAEFIGAGEGYNVLIEAFGDRDHLARIAAAHAQGCRFIYVATEEPTDQGFNHGVAPGMIDRQAAFPEAAQFADGVLHLVPGADVTRWYSQFALSAYAELGYAPTLVYDGRAVDPTFDFGFYGQVTYRRQQILSRLQSMTEKGILVLPNIELPQAQRDHEMRKVRVIITIREHDDMGFVSSSRCATALSLGRPVVAEPHEVCKAWGEVVHFSDSLESFYDDAVVLAQNWLSLHQTQLARFKIKFSPEICIGQPLREIGIS